MPVLLVGGLLFILLLMFFVNIFVAEHVITEYCEEFQLLVLCHQIHEQYQRRE